MVARCDGLTKVTVWRRTLMPSHEVSTATTQMFKKYVDSAGGSLKSMPRPTKEQYFKDFRKLFTWQPCLDEMVRHLWFSKAAERYRDIIHTIKKNMNRKRPAYIPLEVWPIWMAYWEAEETKKKARIASVNRRSEPNGPKTGMITQKGGSRCAVQQEDDLSQAQGLPDEQVGWELFLRLHRDKNGVFTDKKSERLAPVLGFDEVPEVDMTVLYLEALGGMNKKKHVFDTGSQSHFYSGGSSSSIFLGAISPPAFTEEAFTQHVDKMRAKIRDEVRIEIRDVVKTEMQQLQSQMEAQMQARMQAQMEAQ
ncbi:hypothetical protein C2S51_008910 [Perilla frutescens var. frutescens]|nr:hypothetical protein C2S51_008910 [Perilla frutescens var. frutescens]